MAKKRKSKCYRNMKRPYTRVSKYKKKAFVPSTPHLEVARFDMGNRSRKFPKRVSLLTKEKMQVLDNCMESARKTANKFLVEKVGRNNYYFKIKVYPHHICRYNPIAMGAGADRLSTGMRKSFGRPVSRAARLNKGQEIMYIELEKENISKAQKALKRASHKLPVKTHIEITQ